MARLVRSSSLVAALALGLVAAGCGGAGGGSEAGQPASASHEAKPAAKPAAPKVVIGVSLLTRTHPFYQDLEAGLREAADAKGFELLVQAGEFDVARQADQLDDFMVRKVSAIILSPCDSKSIGTTVQAANRAGIPVFTSDIAVLSPDARVECHVASDNVAGGRLAGQALAEALGGHGRVAVIDHPEVESVIQRVAGFREEIAKHPGIEIVSVLPGRGVKDLAMHAAEDILTAHPDLDGIFGINDDSALGALAAVEKAGRLGRVTIVGFDAVPEARKAIADGRIHADVIQQPRDIGRRTVEAVADYLAGKPVPPAILIPCGLYTHESAAGEASAPAGEGAAPAGESEPGASGG